MEHKRDMKKVEEHEKEMYANMRQHHIDRAKLVGHSKEKSLHKAEGGLVGKLKHTIKHYNPKGKLSTKEEFNKQ